MPGASRKTSRSVTDRGGITLLLLQIETEARARLVIVIERGFSDTREWKISRLENERGESATLGPVARQKWEIIHARFQTGENPRSVKPEKPDLDLYIGANESLSK